MEEHTLEEQVRTLRKEIAVLRRHNSSLIQKNRLLEAFLEMLTTEDRETDDSQTMAA
jgi:regulator of replication initiation timing